MVIWIIRFDPLIIEAFYRQLGSLQTYNKKDGREDFSIAFPSVSAFPSPP